MTSTEIVVNVNHLIDTLAEIKMRLTKNERK